MQNLYKIIAFILVCSPFSLFSMEEKEKNPSKANLLAQAALTAQGLDSSNQDAQKYTLKIYDKNGVLQGQKKIREVLAQYSGLLNIHLNQDNQEKELALYQESLKSLSIDEIIHYLSIIHQGYSTHYNYEKIIFDLQTEILLHAQHPKKQRKIFKKLTDICYAANHLDIPELLKAGTTILATEFAKNPAQKNVDLCTQIGPDIANHTANLTHHPVFHWLQTIINSNIGIGEINHNVELLENICFHMNLIVGFSKNNVVGLNFSDPQYYFVIPFNNPVCDVKINPASNILAAVDKNGILYLNYLLTGENARVITPDAKTTNYTIAWNHLNPNQLALFSDTILRFLDISEVFTSKTKVCHNCETCWQYNGNIILRFEWHPTNPTMFAVYTSDGKIRCGPISNPEPFCISTDECKLVCMKWHPMQPDQILVGSDRGIIILIDIVQRKPILQLNGHTKKINDLQFSPHDPNVVLSCSDDKKVIRWDLRIHKNGIVYPIHFLYHDIPAHSIQWHPKIKHVYKTDTETQTRIMGINEAFTFDVIRTKATPKKQFVIFHPTLKYMISSSENTIRILDLHLYYALLKDIYSLTMAQTVHLIGLYNKYHLQKQKPTLQTLHELFLLPDSIVKTFLSYFNLNIEQVTLFFQIIDKTRQNTAINLTADQETMLNELPLLVQNYISELVAQSHVTTGNCS